MFLQKKLLIRADEAEFINIEDWISQGIDTYHLRKFQRSSYRHGFIIRRLWKWVIMLKQVIF